MQGRNATAEELCEEICMTWRMSGNDNENKKTKSDKHELETALGTFKGSVTSVMRMVTKKLKSLMVLE